MCAPICGIPHPSTAQCIVVLTSSAVRLHTTTAHAGDLLPYLWMCVKPVWSALKVVCGSLLPVFGKRRVPGPSIPGHRALGPPMPDTAHPANPRRSAGDTDARPAPLSRHNVFTLPARLARFYLRPRHTVPKLIPNRNQNMKF